MEKKKKRNEEESVRNKIQGLDRKKKGRRKCEEQWRLG
jgi:hypothetical protein